MIFFAGIGPRSTPEPVQETMTEIARQLTNSGWCLRSGCADGADAAFQRGAKHKQIFLPWEGYNGMRSNGFDTGVLPITEKQEQIAREHHPIYDRLSQGAQKLHCRNVPIILGETLDDPVACVIYWLPPGHRGGTTQGLRIASTYGIPTFNLYDQREFDALVDFTGAEEKRYRERN